MFKSTYAHPIPTNTCSVNDMVRVNLFTKLDDSKSLFIIFSEAKQRKQERPFAG